MLFERVHTAPKTATASTRNLFVYLYRSFWFIGINTKPVKSKTTYTIWQVFTCSSGLIFLPISYVINYKINFGRLSFFEFLASLQICLNCWSLSAKHFVIYRYFLKFDEAFEELDKMDKYCETAEELYKIRKASALGNKTFIFFIFMYYSYAVATLISGLINSQPPYNLYFPYLDWRDNKYELYIQITIEFLLVGYAIFSAVATDSCSLIFVLALTVHVDILKSRVAKLGTIELSESERYDELIRCIKVHQCMLRYCDIIRTPMSATIFFQFLFCGTIIGISLINLLVSPNKVSRVVVIIYILAVLGQSFPLCYFCTGLTEICYQLADAIFHSNWMFENQCYKKAILQFLQKVQQPMTFTALDVFPINLATNISVAKFAVSVYAIAVTLNFAEKFEQYGEYLKQKSGI